MNIVIPADPDLTSRPTLATVGPVDGGTGHGAARLPEREGQAAGQHGVGDQQAEGRQDAVQTQVHSQPHAREERHVVFGYSENAPDTRLTRPRED